MTLFFAQAIGAALIIWMVILIQKATKNGLMTSLIIVTGTVSVYAQYRLFAELHRISAIGRSPAVVCTCDKPIPETPEALIHQPNKSLWMNESN